MKGICECYFCGDNKNIRMFPLHKKDNKNSFVGIVYICPLCETSNTIDEKYYMTFNVEKSDD